MERVALGGRGNEDRRNGRLKRELAAGERRDLADIQRREEKKREPDDAKPISACCVELSRRSYFSVGFFIVQKEPNGTVQGRC